MAVGNRGATALAPGSPAAQARHFGRRPGFVKKDKFCGIKIKLAVKPGLAAFLYVVPLLLGGVRCFF
jgi:hypothetical protein